MSLLVAFVILFSQIGVPIVALAAPQDELENYNKQQITTTITQELDDIAESLDLSSSNQKVLLSDLYNLNRYALNVRFLSLCCKKSDSDKNKLDLTKEEVQSYVNELAVLTENFNDQYGTASTKYYSISIKIPKAEKRTAESLCVNIFNKTYKYCNDYLKTVNDAYNNNGSVNSDAGIEINSTDQASLVSIVSPYVYSIKEILENYEGTLNSFKSYDLLKSCYFMESSSKTVTFINNINKILNTDYSTIIDVCSSKIADNIADRQINLSVSDSYVESLTNCIVTEEGLKLAEGEESGQLTDAYKLLLACSAVYEPFVSKSGGDEFTNALKGVCKSLNKSDDYEALYKMYSNVNGFRKPLYFRPYNDSDGTSLGNAKQLTVKEFCKYIESGQSGTLVTIEGKLKQDVSTGTWYYYRSKETTVVHTGTESISDTASAVANTTIASGSALSETEQSVTANTETDTNPDESQTLEQGDFTTMDTNADNSEFQQALDKNEATEAVDIVTRQDMITDPVLKFCYEDSWGRAEDNLTYALLYNILQDAPTDDFQDSNNYLYINAFGDIMDENGVIILPAAANPTYYDEAGKSTDGKTKSSNIVYNPYTVAFMNSYPQITKDGTELKLVDVRDSGKFIITNEIFEGSGIKVLSYYLNLYNDLDDEILELTNELSTSVDKQLSDGTEFTETKGDYLRLAKITQNEMKLGKKITNSAKVDVDDNLECCTINLKFYTDSTETKHILYQAPFTRELGTFAKGRLGAKDVAGKAAGWVGSKVDDAQNWWNTQLNKVGLGSSKEESLGPTAETVGQDLTEKLWDATLTSDLVSDDICYEGSKISELRKESLKSSTSFIVPIYMRSPLLVGGESLFPYIVEDDAVETSSDVAYPAATKIAINMFNSFENSQASDITSAHSTLAENYMIENVVATGLGGTNSTHAYATNNNANYKNVVSDQENRFVKFLNSLSESLINNFGKTTGVIGIHSMYNNNIFGNVFTWIQSYWYLILFVFAIILVVGFLRQEKDLTQSIVHLVLAAALIYVMIAVVPAYLPMIYNSVINEVSDDLSYETLALKAEKDGTTYSASTDSAEASGQGKLGQNVSSITLYKAPLQNPIQSLYNPISNTTQSADSLYDTTNAVMSTSNSFYESLDIERSDVTGGSQYVISDSSGTYAEDDSLKMDLSTMFKNLKVKGGYVENEDGSKTYQFKSIKTTSDNLDYYTPYYSIVDGFVGKLNDLTEVYQIPRSSMRYSDSTIKDKFIVYSYCNSLPFLSGGNYEYTEGNDAESDTGTTDIDQTDEVNTDTAQEVGKEVEGANNTVGEDSTSGDAVDPASTDNADMTGNTEQSLPEAEPEGDADTKASTNNEVGNTTADGNDVGNQLTDYVLNESNSLSDALYETFGDNNDWLGMSEFLAEPSEEQKGTLWYKTMVKNGYYDANGNPVEDKINRLVESVNNNTKKFIFDSPDLINNCSDEVLIKTICLYADTCFNTKISSLTNWVYPFSLNYDDYTLEDTLTSILTASNAQYVGKNLNVVDYVQNTFSWPSLLAFDIMVILLFLVVSIINLVIPCMYLLLCILIILKLFFGKPLITAFRGFAKSNVILFILSVLFNVSLNLMRKLDGSQIVVWILLAVCLIVLYFICLVITSIFSNLSDFGYQKMNAKLDNLDNKMGLTQNLQSIKASFRKEESYNGNWYEDENDDSDYESGFNAYKQTTNHEVYDNDKVILEYQNANGDVNTSKATSGTVIKDVTPEIEFEDE